MPTEAPHLDPRGSSTARRAEAKPHPKATLSPVASGFRFCFTSRGTYANIDATPPSKARGTRKMQQGITKLDQDAYAWNIVLSGQQRTGEEFQG